MPTRGHCSYRAAKLLKQNWQSRICPANPGINCIPKLKLSWDSHSEGKGWNKRKVSEFDWQNYSKAEPKEDAYRNGSGSRTLIISKAQPEVC